MHLFDRHQATIVCGTGGRGGVFRQAFGVFPALSRRARLIRAILALVAAAIPAIVLAPQPYPSPGTHHLEIVVTGRRNPASASTQVWLLGFYQFDRTPVPKSELALYGVWQMHDGVLAADSTGTSLRWEGTLADDARLRFIAHSWSGLVRINWDDSTQTIDLYADPATEREIMLPTGPTAARYDHWAGYSLLAGGASALLAGLLTFLAAGRLMVYAGRRFAGAGADRPRTARLLAWYSLAAAVVAVGAIPLAVALAPWTHAATVPMRLKLTAPGYTLIDVCWDRQASACLPLIPYLDPDFQNAQLWLADLPPAPAYDLTFVFRSPVQDATLDGLTLISVSPHNMPFYERTVEGTPGWFTTEGISVEQRGQNLSLRAAANGKLMIADAVSLYYGITPADIARPWLALVTLCLFGGAIVILLLSPPAVRLPTVPARAARGTWLLWLAFVIAVAGHLLLIRNSPILFGGDTVIYLMKGLALAERGTYDTGGYEFELNRLPGYPLLLACAIKLAGYRLNTIALFQGALFSTSVLALALALRRWMHPLLGALGILAAVLSPVQVWSARMIMAESAFATCATLALACLFQHLGASGRRSKGWLMLFSCLATYASFIRPNGIVLYVALIVVWLPHVRALRAQALSFPAKIWAITRTARPYALVALLLPAAMLGWSVRNYLNRSYFGPTDMIGASTVSGLMESGVFQPQSLIDNQKLYADYLTRRYGHQSQYLGWYLRPPLLAQLTQAGQSPPNDVLRQLDTILLKITARSNALSPWQLRAAALLRVSSWAVFLPAMNTFAGEYIRYSYDQLISTEIPTTPQEIARISQKLIYEEVGENRVFSLYAPFAQHYYDYYFALLLLNLVIFLGLLWRGHVAFTAFFLVFLVNMALNVYLLNVFSRYIQVFDVFLIFQVLIGISMLVGSESAKPALN